MATVHRIRLRGGWKATALPDGVVRHARRFGSPRALDPAESVFLTCDGLLGLATVSVNGETVATATGRLDADITKLLQPRNEVWIDTAGDGELGEVAVEFRAGT